LFDYLSPVLDFNLSISFMKKKEHFKKPTPSYPLREKVWEYLNGRALKSDIIKYIKFGSVIRWVQFDEKALEFLINVEDVKESCTKSHRFDNIIVATGHFTSQLIPHINGLVSFNGPVLHSYHFRDPELYKGKRILIIGTGESAEDVVWHCLQNGALSVTVSNDGRRSLHPISTDSAENVIFKPKLNQVRTNEAYFSDGSFVEVMFTDHLLFMT
jgi:trimethylamine monooxygenase